MTDLWQRIRAPLAAQQHDVAFAERLRMKKIDILIKRGAATAHRQPLRYQMQKSGIDGSNQSRNWRESSLNDIIDIY